MAHAFKHFVLLTAAAGFIPLPVLAGEITVPLDSAITLTLDSPASTVYLANPSIADITEIDKRHFFILGKTFGSTNLIALDAAGRETANEQIIVTDRAVGELTVQRGIARVTMTCTPEHCQANPAPGDDQRAFGADTGEADKQSATGTKAAGGK